MSTIENPDEGNINLMQAFTSWLLCLLVLILILKIPFFSDSNLMLCFSILLYFFAGFYLNRNVLKKLIEWHPVYNTVENISTIKLRFFLFWPIAYAILLFRLMINKVL